MTSKATLTGEDEDFESDLKYLHVIKAIRDDSPAIFERIKRLPRKARTAKTDEPHADHLLTYFRRGKIQKFFLSDQREANELDFITAAQVLETGESAKQQSLSNDFYKLLERNKQEFEIATSGELPDAKLRGGRDSATQILMLLKAALKDRRQFTEDQELYLKKVVTQLEEGGLPKQTTRVTLQALKEEVEKGINPMRIMAVLETQISPRLLEGHRAESGIGNTSKRKVILSEYLTK